MTGHRTYLKAGEKLITTRPVKPPIARGHRTWLDVKPREDA